MQLTDHAAQRMQQRGIAPIVVDLLFQFGAREPAGDGTEKLFFNKSSRKQLKTYAGPLASYLVAHLDVYMLIAPDDKIITTGHRLERVRRH